jgi:NAD(P)-dependent dehydrogenase (short-subunit alcohol dehydrogenase family)
MSKVEDKVCVVTGAGSGIGRALAFELVRCGARAIAISDVNESSAGETASMLEKTGPAEVHSAKLDVSDRQAFADYATEVAAHFGVVHQIYNNAGIADSDLVGEFDYERYERILGINLWGVIHGTREFLPHLIASGDGHIVNVSSINGIVAQRELTGYCASKFAVRGFTESVALDLQSEGHPVGVSVVHPGGVRTEIANSALEWAKKTGLPVTAEHEERNRLYNEKLLKMDPARAARIIVGGVESDKPRILVGNDARFLDALVRFTPSHWPKVFRQIERRYE